MFCIKKYQKKHQINFDNNGPPNTKKNFVLLIDVRFNRGLFLYHPSIIWDLPQKQSRKKKCFPFLKLKKELLL